MITAEKVWDSYRSFIGINFGLYSCDFAIAAVLLLFGIRVYLHFSFVPCFHENRTFYLPALLISRFSC